MRKFTAILLAVFIIVIALGAALIMRWTREIPAETLASARFAAAVADSGGVDTASTFIITFNDEVGSAAAQRALSVTPKIELGVHQGAAKNEIQVVPAEPLAAGTVYTFTLASGEFSAEWAFQTKSALEITKVSPADRETGVTAPELEITFNQLLAVDLARAADYVTISPTLDGSFNQRGRTLCFTPEQGFAPGTVYTVTIAAGLPLLGTTVTLAEEDTFSFETVLTSADRQLKLSAEAVYATGETPLFALSIADTAAIDNAGNEAALNAALTVGVSLYTFPDAETYAAELARLLSAHPSWSEGLAYARDCDLSRAELRSTMRMLLTKNGSNYTLTWPTAPPSGYYLLRLSYRGVTRDALFAVSDLDAYQLECADRALFWLHQAAEGGALSGTVRNVVSGAVARVDKNGLAEIDLPRGDQVYLFRAVGQTLVLTAAGSGSGESDNAGNWRYLYLDRNNYQNGATLNYWGLVLPRDGSPLEYERVSVYIVAEGAREGDYLYREYAELQDNMFSGSIVLPYLLAGSYGLEIWQSGRLLVSRAFTIGPLRPEESSVAAPLLGEQLLLDDEDGYALGSNFAAAYHQGAGRYLFISLAGGITGRAVGGNELYLGSFAPGNMLNSYLLAVCYHNGVYRVSQPALLYRDYRGYALPVTIIAEDVYQPGRALPFSVAVTDAAGTPLGAAQVAVSVLAGDAEPAYDTLAAIWEDYQSSGLSPENPGRVVDTWLGDALFFGVYTTDENGVISGEAVLPAVDQPCYILAQAIGIQGGEAYAGSAWRRISSAGAPTETDIPGQEAVQEADGSVGGDVFKSARSVFATPGQISSWHLLQYLDTVLAGNYSRQAYIAALAGQAAAGAPTLNELKQYLDAGELSAEEQLWLALGLYACGDRQVALTLAAGGDAHTAEERRLSALFNAQTIAEAGNLPANGE